MASCQADFMKLDLSSLKQVKDFAMNFKEKRLPLQLEGRKPFMVLQPTWVLLDISRHRPQVRTAGRK